MVETQITEEMIEIAKARREVMPKVIRNSIMGGERTFEGCLGEVVVANYLSADYITTYDFDLMHNGKKIEVKTKVRTVLPKPFYEVSIANYNTKQLCDYYVFVSLYVPNKDEYPTIAHIVGYFPKDDYISQSNFLKKGDIDTRNNYTVRADCWNMAIKDLIDIKKI